jgi:hypothetical protein
MSSSHHRHQPTRQMPRKVGKRDGPIPEKWLLHIKTLEARTFGFTAAPRKLSAMMDELLACPGMH